MPLVGEESKESKEYGTVSKEGVAPAKAASPTPSNCCNCCNISHNMKNLLFIKGFYFFFFAGLGSLAPFITIIFKQYGLSPAQIGLIFGLRPIIGFLSGPIWGVLADKFRIRRVLLMASMMSWVAVFVAVAFVKPANQIKKCPDNLKPHRVTFHHIVSHNTETSSRYNLSANEVAILKEDIGWIYVPEDLHRVFVTYLLLILLGEFVQSPTTTLGDAGTLAALGEEKLSEYGRQRAWGSIGWAISSVSVGAVIAQTRREIHKCTITLYFSEYYFYVYIFSACLCGAFICVVFMPFQEKVPCKDPDSNTSSNTNSRTKVLPPPPQTDPHRPMSPSRQTKKEYSVWSVVRVFLNVHYGSWILTAFIVGNFNGIIWGFLNWHLDNLGADSLLIGTANVVKCVCEFITFFVVHIFTAHLGHMGVMYISLCGYLVMFTGYGLLVHPWWVLPFEIIHGITFSCIWVSLTSYSALAVPSVALGTIQGILHGVYFGLGNGTGHLIGGMLIGYFGARLTFLSLTGCCMLTGISLFSAQQLSKKPSLDYEELEEEKEAVHASMEMVAPEVAKEKQADKED